MESLNLIDAGLDGSVVFELHVTPNFSNLNGTPIHRSTTSKHSAYMFTLWCRCNARRRRRRNLRHGHNLRTLSRRQARILGVRVSYPLPLVSYSALLTFPSDSWAA